MPYVKVRPARPGKARKRRHTRAQLWARQSYGAPLPLQPRRPLRRLPPGHPLAGRVPVITGEALRADPALLQAYLAWVMGNADQWLADERVSLWAIFCTWDAHERP